MYGVTHVLFSAFVMSYWSSQPIFHYFFFKLLPWGAPNGGATFAIRMGYLALFFKSSLESKKNK